MTDHKTPGIYVTVRVERVRPGIGPSYQPTPTSEVLTDIPETVLSASVAAALLRAVADEIRPLRQEAF